MRPIKPCCVHGNEAFSATAKLTSVVCQAAASVPIICSVRVAVGGQGIWQSGSFVLFQEVNDAGVKHVA